MAAEHTIDLKMNSICPRNKVVNILGEFKKRNSPLVNRAMLLGNTSVAWH